MSSEFLELPEAVRERVYQYLFADVRVLICCHNPRERHHGEGTGNNPLDIRLVCRRLLTEPLKAFLSSATFELQSRYHRAPDPTRLIETSELQQKTFFLYHVSLLKRIEMHLHYLDVSVNLPRKSYNPTIWKHREFFPALEEITIIAEFSFEELFQGVVEHTYMQALACFAYSARAKDTIMRFRINELITETSTWKVHLFDICTGREKLTILHVSQGAVTVRMLMAILDKLCISPDITKRAMEVYLKNKLKM